MDHTAFPETKFLQSALHGLVILMGINAHISASLQSIRKSSPGHTLCYSIGSDSVNHAVGLPVAVLFTIFDHTVSRILSCKKYKCSHNSPIFHAYIGNSCFYIIFYR